MENQPVLPLSQAECRMEPTAAGPGSGPTPTVETRQFHWVRWSLIATLVLIGLSFAIVFLQRWQYTQGFSRSLTLADEAWNAGDLATAEQHARDALQRNPAQPDALLLSARLAATRRDWTKAHTLCDQLPLTLREKFSQQLFVEGEAGMERGRARRAEESLRLSYYLDGEQIRACYALAFLLAAEGRAWEALPFVRTLIDQGMYDVPQLLLIGSPEEFFIEQPQFLKQCLEEAPEDSLPRLGLGRLALLKDDPSSAEDHFSRVATQDRELSEAQVRWGRILLEKSNSASFLKWHQQLPASTDDHPEIWVIRGRWLVSQNQIPAGIRCFAEAVNRDPNHLEANLQLGRLLSDRGQQSLAQRFQTRTQLLSQLIVPLKVFQRERSPGSARRVIELLENLGRLREVLAWTTLLLKQDPDLEWARQFSDRISNQFPQTVPWITDSARLATQVDRSQFPLPRWTATRQDPKPESTQSSPAIRPSESSIQFENQAEMLGIRVEYQNDSRSSEDNLHMYQFGGANGIGILDLDGDGWSDLYLTQGGRFPQEPVPAVWKDQCFRNDGDGRFTNITTASHLGDTRFSQGVTVGDYNQDGFDDLFVANIGSSRLYQNQGDGTFTDITDQARLQTNEWTVSCLLADLNGDSLPDLYAVNYVTDSDVFSRICEAAGRPQQCPPGVFSPQQDRVWLNDGAGEFKEQTAQALTKETTAGRGLGIVGAALDDPRLLNLFIANDTDPNFWYLNQTNETTNRLQFQEQGVASGLAFDAAGIPKAGMGIAAGDVDRDGRLDFLVTNFYRESNTLFLQQSPGLFSDQTRAAGLYEPSYLMLGFGTQFLDADCDGWLDLVVANGHVYNNTHLSEPWKMPTQFFWNQRNGTFAELRAPQLSSYFRNHYLGRAVARWDWNRDGRPDIVISHADAPLAVLTNTTQHNHHNVIFSLRGVKSNREGIGAIIHIQANSQNWTHTVVAGDGYQSRNEHRVTLGVGQAQQIDRLQIHWPSGGKQVLQNLPVDQELIIIEGQAAVLMTPSSN